MNVITAGKLSIPLKKKMKKYSQTKMLKLLPNQINVINSGSESDINNKMQVNVERDTKRNDRQTEKTRKMFSRPSKRSII